MSETSILSTHNLQVGYKDNILFQDASLQLPQGKMTLLLGANGKGKSTLLKVLAHSLAPLAGSVEINGVNINNISPRDFARLLAIVNTDRVHASLTAYELVGMGRQPYTGFFGRNNSQDRDIIMEAMEKCSVTHLARRKVHTLSDGERQKVMIARAIAQQTPIILLDEPTSFLDVAARLQIMNMLRDFADNGKTILLSTHDITEGLKMASHAWILPAKENNIISRSVEEMTHDPALMNSLFLDNKIQFNTKTFNFSLQTNSPC